MSIPRGVAWPALAFFLAALPASAQSAAPTGIVRDDTG